LHSYLYPPGALRFEQEAAAMNDDIVLMPIQTALALAAMALEASVEDTQSDGMRVILRRAQDVVERLSSLPPEVLEELDDPLHGRSARRTVRYRYARRPARLH
jgi:hypothetical protein